MKKTKVDHYTDKEALEFHSHKKPGKIEISSSKNMTTKYLDTVNILFLFYLFTNRYHALLQPSKFLYLFFYKDL